MIHFAMVWRLTPPRPPRLCLAWRRSPPRRLATSPRKPPGYHVGASRGRSAKNNENRYEEHCGGGREWRFLA
ncbi:hypothetical protein CBM2585_B50167 [Cupriavidus taiwanensis]|nr:hypothetical protein CBM2585_B50167 [Cupriavidus taiwanensis]